MNVYDYLDKKDKYHKIIQGMIDHKVGQNIYVANSARNAGIILSSMTFNKTNKSIVYVTENIFNASKAYETFVDLLGADYVSFFPVEEFISSELIASSNTFRLARMLTLNNIVENKPQLIVTCPEGLTKMMMSKSRIEESIIKLKVGDTIDPKNLALELVERGYKKVSITEEMGTFSVRGSIIDIYPINLNTVYRLDFFDDEIEKIKKVNITTQMSEGTVQDVCIFPLYDIYFKNEELENIKTKIKKTFNPCSKVDSDISKLENYTSLDQMYIYLPCIDENYCNFLELFDNPLCIYENVHGILKHEEDTLSEIKNYLDSVNFKTKSKIFNKVTEMFDFGCNYFIEKNLSSLNGIKLTELIDLKTSDTIEYNNNIKPVMEDIKLNKNRTYIITHFDDHKMEFLKETFKNNQIEYIYNDKISEKKVNLIIDSGLHGFIDYEENFEILTPYEFAPGKINKNSKYQKYYKNSIKVYTKDELTAGDYVVHQDYGIGIYLGIVTRIYNGKNVDYLLVQYAGESKLYIPVENVYLLEKYVTSNDSKPKINDLSGKEWRKKKERVKQKVLDVAKRLIKVQAERELRQGYIYEPDTISQLEFESDFEYEETVDQAKAIHDVKQDMESERPLDRLICGDVGFGKTEVALRAAFKAVENGKQVAYLAPTTVLTRQHYYTFKERCEKYGIAVELLNRFVTPQKQKDVLKKLDSGYVDIIIGTHRLLSKDIKFKDLGLLIVDEEQRFGVIHKERIKEMKANVDVLTLTATPIPRTLQMALSGLRDLSLIETPPTNRLPVQTYVLEANESVIREAINRELGRNGQVFYLLNRIDDLERTLFKVHRLCPYAKIGMIHGKLDKDKIEDELEKFLERQYDVLLCTTIIETGIDIPNANTLIIERADILGLSQLYQIRGRVGRSDRISYAYLMYEGNKVLTHEAELRLNAIKEFTDLGSGYKIAMRDLAIRGAGDILGEEQSGFIDAIGMDLYMKLLNEAIDELKGTIKTEKQEKNFRVNVDRHIDTSYVSEDEIRIEMHKQISRITSRQQIKELIDEFTDRYGKVSEEILVYMEEKYLEFLLKSRGVESYKETPKDITVTFSMEATEKLNFRELAKIAKETAPKFEFTFKSDRLAFIIYPSQYDKSYIYTLTKFLELVQLKDN